MAAIDIDIAVEAGEWGALAPLEELCRTTVQAAVVYLEETAGQPFPDTAAELSVLLTDDAAIRVLNAEWRGKDKPTNVLSFPAFPLAPGSLPGPMLGDLVLAHETIEAEAVELGITFTAHFSHLIVHGLLHLLGYDHIEADEAEVMEGLETRILATLGLSDPYGDSDPA